MGDRSLFRKELEQARADSWLGKVILTRPVSFTFMCAAALVFAAALGAFFIFGEYTRKARVTGVLAPEQGIVKIIAQQAGVVEAVHAVEGGTVAKDAPLIVLSDGRSASGAGEIGSAVGERLHERRMALARQRDYIVAALHMEREATRDRVARLAGEIGELDVELAAQAARTRLAVHGAGLAKGLESVGFLSPAATDRERD